MVRDVTTTWERDRAGGGLYVVRSTKPGSEDKLRIGAGGNHGGAGGIFSRLRKHRSPPPKAAMYGTHDHQPYGIVERAWSLEGWLPPEIEDGEHCLYRPFLVRYPRLVGERTDRSLFIVDPGEDLTGIFEQVTADLEQMEELRRR